jgi:hypothetical protein
MSIHPAGHVFANIIEEDNFYHLRKELLPSYDDIDETKLRKLLDEAVKTNRESRLNDVAWKIFKRYDYSVKHIQIMLEYGFDLAKYRIYGSTLLIEEARSLQQTMSCIFYGEETLEENKNIPKRKGIIEYLIQSGIFDLNATDKHNERLICYLAGIPDLFPLLKTLVYDKRIDISNGKESKNIPMVFALKSGNRDCILYLSEYGYKITPIMIFSLIMKAYGYRNLASERTREQSKALLDFVFDNFEYTKSSIKDGMSIEECIEISKQHRVKMEQKIKNGEFIGYTAISDEDRDPESF